MVPPLLQRLPRIRKRTTHPQHVQNCRQLDNRLISNMSAPEEYEDFFDEDHADDYDVAVQDDVDSVDAKLQQNNGPSQPRHIALKQHVLYAYAKKKDGSHDTDPLAVLNCEVINAVAVDGNALKISSAGEEWNVQFDNADAAAKWKDLVNTAKEEFSQQGALTPELKEALEKLRARIAEDDQLKDRTHNDSELVRFIRGHTEDIDRSMRFYREYLVWRDEFNVDKMTVADVVDELKTNTLWLTGTKDYAGRPIVVYNFRNHDPKVSSPLDTIRSLIYVMERAFEQMDGDQDEVCLLADCSDLSLKKYDDRTERLTFDILLHRYPGRVGLIVCSKAPWYFRILWKVISRWMPKQFSSVTHVLKSRCPRTFVAEENLPVQLGGTLTHDQDDWIAKRYAAEGVEPGTKNTHDGDDRLLKSLSKLSIRAKDFEDTEYTGWMTKRGYIVKNWKKRYFVLKDGLLYYFKKEKSMKPRGIINLERCRVTDEEFKDKENSFQLVTPLRTFVFIPENSAGRVEWMNVLKRVCESLQK